MTTTPRRRPLAPPARPLPAVLLLAACTAMPNAPSAPSPRVTGTVSYVERIALAPDAVVRVQLVDVSRADAPAEVLGEQTFAAQGKQVPLAFSIPYDPARVDQRHSYAVQARIEVGGALRWISDRSYPVITRGAPSQVELVLRAVGGTPR